MERPYPLQNRHFEAKVKIIKTKGKTTLEPNQSCSVKKTAPRNKNNYKTTLELFCTENGSKKHPKVEKRQHIQNGQNWPPCKGYSQNRHLRFKIKTVNQLRKTTLEQNYSCCVQKNRFKKNTDQSKNDNISKMAKIEHHGKAISFAKSSL